MRMVIRTSTLCLVHASLTESMTDAGHASKAISSICAVPDWELLTSCKDSSQISTSVADVTHYDLKIWSSAIYTSAYALSSRPVTALPAVYR